MRVLTYSDLPDSLNGSNRSDAVLRISLEAQGSGIPNHSPSFKQTNFFHAQTLGKSMLHDPNLQLNAVFFNGTEVQFAVTAQEAVAAWVTLEEPAGPVKGYFEHNCFWRMKGEKRVVVYREYGRAKQMRNGRPK